MPESRRQRSEDGEHSSRDKQRVHGVPSDRQVGCIRGCGRVITVQSSRSGMLHGVTELIYLMDRYLAPLPRKSRRSDE